MGRPLFVTGLQPLLPAYAIPQPQSLAWLADAHTRAAGTRARQSGTPFDEGRHHDQIARRLSRFGCGESKIASRHHALEDCAHTRWSSMRIYPLDRQPEGAGMLERTRAYGEVAEGAFSQLYAEAEAPPSDLLHVTCTGYLSPSAAQRLVAARGWGDTTRVTHAYHMGCYAALPALRIASGLVSAADALRGGPEAPRQADIVHTELCSLHLNPLADSPEQLVVQTLFADGFIRYSVGDEASWGGRGAAFEILALDEVTVPNSADSMSWVASEWGMTMTLARDVPEKLGASVRPFVSRLLARAGLDAGSPGVAGAAYAVHPGGPRILDRVRDALELAERQIEASRRVLLARGNMSSATLPHIWRELTAAPVGTLVVSLAFGPGLTLCGAVFRLVAAGAAESHG